MTSNPLIIPVFLPNLGCRQQCLFCNQKSISERILSPSEVRDFIEASLRSIPSQKKEREKQVAFYGGSFTAIARSDQARYLEQVRPFMASGQIDSIRISTRPDALDEDVLAMLNIFGVKTIEVGTQSMINEVLSLARRGHASKDTADAVFRLKERGFQAGVQLMIGLPGDTRERFLQTLDRVIELHPDFVRIHPTLVLKGAPLKDLWKSGQYVPLTLEDAIDWLKRGLFKLEHSSIRVARIGLQPTKDLERDYLAGPFHPSLHQLVESAIFFDMAERLLKKYSPSTRTVFICHPSEVSNFRGQKNENLLKLQKCFTIGEIFIQENQTLSRGTLGLQTQEGEAFLHKTSLVF